MSGKEATPMDLADMVRDFRAQYEDYEALKKEREKWEVQKRDLDLIADRWDFIAVGGQIRAVLDR